MATQAKTWSTALIGRALGDSFIKMDPRVMIRNPVMFVVEVGFVVTSLLTVNPDLFGGHYPPAERTYNAVVSVVLLLTVLFGNFAEAIAEGRGKAQAESLRRQKADLMARKRTAQGVVEVPATSLTRGDIVEVEAGQLIPADGEVIEGF